MTATPQDIEVKVGLSDGQVHASVLPLGSPILERLYVALATHNGAEQSQPATLIQLPLEGGHVACSFLSTSVISVTTKPPVLIHNTAQSEPEAAGFAAPSTSYVKIDGFLTPAENAALLDYALANESDYVGSTVSTKAEGYRRSKVLFSIKESKWRDVFLARLKLHLPHICASLDFGHFTIASDEIQLTASNDGDFFKAHGDVGGDHEPSAIREITFVYYFNREPRPYRGGNILFYPGEPGVRQFDTGSAVTSVTPQNNSLIAFNSRHWHEVDMVRCPSGAFADSRFTVNGWLSRKTI